MAKRSIPITKRLIKKSIERYVKYIEDNDGEKNPQIRDMRLKAMGRVDALQGVLESIDGDHVILKILAGE